MGKITFILGGARSGKSRYAVKLARETNTKKVAFVATCLARDEEIKRRIALHKKSRPSHWQTFEEQEDIAALIQKVGNKFDVIIIDCLTLLVSNLLLKNLKHDTIEDAVSRMLFDIKKAKSNAIVVSNEVGLGIVPKNKLARDFRDVAGRINQSAANEADRVVFMISGIPWEIK